MSLRERDLHNDYSGDGGKPCSVAAARERLTPEDRELLDEWLAVPAGTPGRRSDRYIAELINAELGERVTANQPVGHHRRGHCRCSRQRS